MDEYRSLYNNKDTKTTPASSYLTGGVSSQPTPYAASKQSTGAMRGSGTLAVLIAQYEYYIKLKKEAVQNNDAEGIKQYDDKLAEITKELRNDRTELQGFSDDLKAAGDTSDELENITWQLKTIDDLLLSPGQNLVNFIDKNILTGDKQKLVELANAGKLTQDELSSNFSEIDKYLKGNGLTLEDLISIIKTYREEILDTFINKTGNLSISQTVVLLNTRLKPAFDSLQSAYQDIFTDDGKFALNSIDILSTCDTIKSKLDAMSNPEGLNLNVDYSAFEDFVRVLNNTGSTEQDVENAFNALATSITQAALSGTEDFETLKSALEDLGVVNEELVAFQALASNVEMLEQALAESNASMDDFIVNTKDGSVEATNAGQAFLEEKVGAEKCAEALKILAFHKELCGLQDMNTAGEITNLLTLAEKAGYMGEVIQYLTELEQIYQEVARGTLSPGVLDKKLAKAEELQGLIKDSTGKINYEPKVDYSGGKKSAKSAGKEAAATYLEAFEKELKDLDALNDRGNADFR